VGWCFLCWWLRRCGASLLPRRTPLHLQVPLEWRMLLQCRIPRRRRSRIRRPSQSRFPGQPMTPIEANSMYLAQMKGMMDQLKTMQSELDEIKANTTKVKDPTLKQQLELDNELWAMMSAQLQPIDVSTAQSRSYARFGSAEQAYRQHRQALRQPPVPPAPTTPATSAAPVISDSKPAAPSDYP